MRLRVCLVVCTVLRMGGESLIIARSDCQDTLGTCCCCFECCFNTNVRCFVHIRMPAEGSDYTCGLAATGPFHHADAGASAMNCRRLRELDVSQVAATKPRQCFQSTARQHKHWMWCWREASCNDDCLRGVASACCNGSSI